MREEELGDTYSQRAEVGAGLTQVLGRWQRVLFVRLSNETTTEARRHAQAPNFYVFPGISYSTLPSYIVGGKPRPYLCSASCAARRRRSARMPRSCSCACRASVCSTSRELWHLRPAQRARHQRIDSDRRRNLDLPASQRFFAGGERSVRGFALNELSPRDDERRQIGGKHLATGTVEVVRDLPRNFGVAAFYDIGNAFDDFSDPQLEYSAGLGVRYSIAVASFGVDVAQPIVGVGPHPAPPPVHLDAVLNAAIA